MIVALALLPVVVPSSYFDNSDWPPFAVGARIITSDRPSLLYDPTEHTHQWRALTGNRVLTQDIQIGNYISPPWFALMVVPFAALDSNIGPRLWDIVQLVALGLGLALLAGTRDRVRMLPALAGAPAAAMILTAQMDGLVVLGLGAAWALWLGGHRFAAGLALGLCLVKPQLLLPLAGMLLLARMWPVIAGWAVSLAALSAAVALRDPGLLVQWPRYLLGSAGHIGTEIGLPGLVLMVGSSATLASFIYIAIGLASSGIVISLAWRRRANVPSAVAVVLAGGLLAAPHALSYDMVAVRCRGCLARHALVRLALLVSWCGGYRAAPHIHERWQYRRGAGCRGGADPPGVVDAAYLARRTRRVGASNGHAGIGPIQLGAG